MNPHDEFKQQRIYEIEAMGQNERAQSESRAFLETVNSLRYSYHFDWMGRPIIQYPQDIVAMQELIWEIKPDLIIETGIAHGGSLILSASMLALLDMAEAIESGSKLDPRKSSRRVVGVDIDIREHNRAAIEAHPMSSRITMIQGSSVSEDVVSHVHEIAKDYNRVLVCLDSNHTHDHVLAELNAYASLTSVGSYCVVFDTVVEDLPKSMFPDRPWGPSDNPKTAVHEFLKSHSEFEIDKSFQNKLLLTVAPDGYLRRRS
ncbi:cephalosporin hydroxylase family protein [Agrobacterium tumefaciens]|uniref:cephalosporin hydroxylase family protein n=1 Tax=Agrobacterium tumefaciens TaxID=358 RepID=UPI00287D81D1|nr:cephalosporin hydroxylase family protein [Agrobacterium tumefaciens]MDS7594765.1 cephalosporin hydroxylase family protein [Agrobacterium tumefaciens]